MKKSRALAAGAVLTLALGAAACGDDDDDDGGTDDTGLTEETDLAIVDTTTG